MINTTEFNTLESLYKHVESKIITKYDIYKITPLFKSFRDNKKGSKPDESDKAQWEIDFLSFDVKEGEIGPGQWRYENNQAFAYPCVESFDERAYEYLIERLNATTHPKLRAQYAQILWCSSKKHRKYAQLTIDSYLELIEKYKREYDSKGNAEKHSFAEEISDSIINAYSVTRQSKDRVEELKAELKRLIEKFCSNTPFWAVTLIKFMLSRRREFTKKDFTGMEEFCSEMAENSENDSLTAIPYLELGKRLDQKLGNQSDDWVRRIARHREILMKKVETSPLMAMDYCMAAIRNYQQIGDDKKVAELKDRYAEFRASVKFTSSNPDMSDDIREIAEACKDPAKEIVKHNTSDNIIKYLIFKEGILPTLQVIDEVVNEQVKKFPTEHIIDKVILDERGNPTKHFNSAEEKLHFDRLQNYMWQLECYNCHVIREIFFNAILAEKLKFTTLMDFVKKHCWYGKELPWQPLDDRTVQFINWTDLIEPGLKEYFCQIEYYLADRATHLPNFVLSLDSLTLKIEGLLRHMCHLMGVSTSRHKPDRSKRDTVYEEDITALLNNEAIKKLLDRDDLFFFRFLLTEQWGLKLRHDIAHSFMSSQGYCVDYVHLVILALLRLAKYDPTHESSADATDGKRTG